MTYFSQMAGLAVQNFVSAGRRHRRRRRADPRHRRAPRRPAQTLGNFWQRPHAGDALRAAADRRSSARCVLVSQGVAADARAATRRRPSARGPGRLAGGDQGARHQRRRLLQRQLGDPVREPDRVLELRRDVPDPVHPGLADRTTYGRMVGNRRQGWAIFAAMSLLFIVSVAIVYVAERTARRRSTLPASTPAFDGSTGGNLEGKEQRFGIAELARCSTAVTTVTSCGAVNAAFESLTGIGGLVPMANLGLRRVGLRRRRHRPLHDAAVRPAGGLHRRPDGRPHARVPRQEDRGRARSSSSSLGGPRHAARSCCSATGAGARRRSTARPSIYAVRPAGLPRDALRLPLAGQQQRLGVRRLHGLPPARRAGNVGAHGVTFADVARRPRRCSAAASCRSSLVLAVAGALAGKRVAPAGLGTMRTDTPTFVVLLDRRRSCSSAR